MLLRRSLPLWLGRCLRWLRLRRPRGRRTLSSLWLRLWRLPHYLWLGLSLLALCLLCSLLLLLLDARRLTLRLRSRGLLCTLRRRLLCSLPASFHLLLHYRALLLMCTSRLLSRSFSLGS
jgi:hypothetical protein